MKLTLTLSNAVAHVKVNFGLRSVRRGTGSLRRSRCSVQHPFADRARFWRSLRIFGNRKNGFRLSAKRERNIEWFFVSQHAQLQRVAGIFIAQPVFRAPWNIFAVEIHNLISGQQSRAFCGRSRNDRARTDFPLASRSTEKPSSART